MKKVILFAVVLLTIACKNQNGKSEQNTLTKHDMTAQAPTGEASKSGMSDVATAPNSSAEAMSKTAPDGAFSKRVIVPISTYSTPLRKIVRTAQVKSKVDNTEQATYRIEQIARKFNGFVAETHLESRNLNNSETVISKDSILEITQFEVANRLVLRVPNEHLDTFLSELSRLYTHLDFRRITGEDVTATFLINQLKAQLRDASAQRIAEASAEKGKRLSDITNAEESRVNLKDAAIEQQIQNLETDYNIAFSVVNVEIYQNAVVSKTMKANVGSLAASANFGFRLSEALSGGWSVLLDVFLFFTHLWAFILFGLAGFWAYRCFKGLRFSPFK